MMTRVLDGMVDQTNAKPGADNRSDWKIWAVTQLVAKHCCFTNEALLIAGPPPVITQLVA